MLVERSHVTGFTTLAILVGAMALVGFLAGCSGDDAGPLAVTASPESVASSAGSDQRSADRASQRERRARSERPMCRDGAHLDRGGVMYTCRNGQWQAPANTRRPTDRQRQRCADGARLERGNVVYVCENGRWSPSRRGR